MSKWKLALITALFIGAGVSLTFVGPPPDGSALSQTPPERSKPGQQAIGDGAGQVDELSAARPTAGLPTGDVSVQRMYSPQIAQHHLVNPAVLRKCESPEDQSRCQFRIAYNHAYYDPRRFDTATLETLADNYDPIAALVLAQRASYKPEQRTRRFLDAVTYSGLAGPLVIMLRDFENDPTSLVSAINRCKYLYVATWMHYPFDGEGRILGSACDNVAALGGDPETVRNDARALLSEIRERRRATVGEAPGSNGGAS